MEYSVKALLDTAKEAFANYEKEIAALRESNAKARKEAYALIKDHVEGALVKGNALPKRDEMKVPTIKSFNGQYVDKYQSIIKTLEHLAGDSFDTDRVGTDIPAFVLTPVENVLNVVENEIQFNLNW